MVPVRDAVARLTVFPVPTFLLAYAAVSEVRATFVALFASPAGTLTRVNCALSVIVEAVDWLYVFVDETTSAPPIVNGRAVMFAEKLGWVSA